MLKECGNVATKIKIIFNFHLLLIKTENLQIKSVTHIYTYMQTEKQNKISKNIVKSLQRL